MRALIICKWELEVGERRTTYVVAPGVLICTVELPNDTSAMISTNSMG